MMDDSPRARATDPKRCAERMAGIIAGRGVHVTIGDENGGAPTPDDAEILYGPRLSRNSADGRRELSERRLARIYAPRSPDLGECIVKEFFELRTRRTDRGVEERELAGQQVIA